MNGSVLSKFDTWDEIQGDIASHTVSILGLSYDSGKENVELICSATIVRYKRLKGFLTAAHALEQIKTFKKIGFCQFSNQTPNYQHIVEIIDNVIFFEELTMYDKNNDAYSGPDIAIFSVSDFVFEKITSISSIVDLEKHKANFDSCGKNLASFAAVIGAIAEWKGNEYIDERGQRKIGIGGVIEVCKPEKVNAENDVIILRPVPDEAHKPPQSYGGLSGGGVWFIFDCDGRKIRQFSGVVYYETEILENHLRNFVAQGPNTLFNDLLSRIDAW